MAAIEATEAEVSDSIAGKEKELALAAINGPSSTVISGTEATIEEIRNLWEDKGRKTKRLAVSHAFHSPLMEPMLAEFAEVAESLQFHEPKLPIVSNVSGELLSAEQATDPAYWVNHVRQPVRFADAISTLQAQGTSTYLELGPDPVLCAMARECLGEEQDTAAFIPTLREGRVEAEAIVTAIAGAHLAGAKLDWGAFFKGTNAKRVPLPTYPFQRIRYWIASATGSPDASAVGLTATDHPLLGAAIEDPDGDELILSGRLSLATHPWLTDHVVGGSVLLPGTAFLELALRAGEEVGAETVEELTLQAPLVLPEAGAVALQVVVATADEDGRREIAIHSRREGGGEEGLAEAPVWTRHAEGSLSFESGPAFEPLDAWPPEGAEPIEVGYLYDVLAEHGLEYGPAFRGLGAAWKVGEQIYAEVALPEEVAQEAERFGIHPALLDSALHAIALAATEGSGELKLPFSWSGVSLGAGGARELRVALRPTGESMALQIADGMGAPVAGVGALAMRVLDPSQLQGSAQARDGLLGIEWAEVDPTEGAEDPAGVETLRCDIDAGLGGAGAARKAAREALAAIQHWLAEESKADLRLALITQGAMAVLGGEAPDPAAAAVWGLVRSAQSEHPGRFALIDTDGSEASEAALSAALARGAEEPQLALREGAPLAPRAMPIKDTEDALIPPPGPWRLDALERGTLESLALIPNPQEPLGPTGVRIQMQAAGLNFRDVLVALGVYPGEMSIGGEGAGVVIEIGSAVDDLTPGDRVMGLILDAFASLATTERDLLTRVPAGWSFEQAAAMPIVFATAHYGLRDLAKLKKGERVLIHAGAGGVGTAAIQIAQEVGAEVFATASRSKWEVLKEAGLDEDHIASSRDLEFKDKFLEVTDGEGVDVVLNALAGEFVDASLALLPNGGRFLEMGKTDIRDREQVGGEYPGVDYMPFDVTEAGPVRTGEMLAELATSIEAGVLSHSPIEAWDMREAPQAFRHLREGNNVGKLVLRLPQAIDPERTTLITGATGGLGALTARHLAEQYGARQLLLVSRSGAAADGAEELQAELEELGASTTIAACDVSDRKALKKLLGSIPAEHPLGAVVHCAGVLADATVESLDTEQVDRVFAPKVDAAQNLHELTADADLSAFVLYSSAAGALGGPGQGNYAAANVFLDTLAQRRKAEGLAATSIAWGPWQRDGGMVAGLSEADLARMRRGGIETLSDERGLALLDAALDADRPQTLAIPIDSAGLRALASVGALPPILSGLVRTPKRRSASSGSLATKLASLPEADHREHVLTLVRSEVAAVLGHSSAREIEPGKAFQDLGFDSLASVELRNRLNGVAGLRLPPTVVFDYPTAAALAEHLLSEASAVGGAAKVAVRAQASEEPVAIVGMACRYPGGIASPRDLWQLVAEGRDGISEFPADRGWDLERLYHPDPDNPGTSYAREGGFVADAADFDAEFFGISPREALAMDPQQRMLLETCWEALEDAGIDPTSLRGEPAGVFAGISSQDYMAGTGTAVGELEGYLSTGSLTSVVSGRAAYVLGVEGPAMTVDTACSSSLVTLHLAAQALRQGECTLALAGGVTILATPGGFTEFSRQRGLAPNGRCKAFADAADGTGFSEGVGMVVLERLSEARRNGHPVLALLKGSAVNQDGASNGLTAPNGPSQERVIRQALANARLEPKDVDAVEAHGTGTMLGDPIEAGALLATYGQDRDEPLKLGSIKSNIGHTQAAAGVAGAIKMIEAMRAGVLPKTLHVDAPSSHVDWEAGEIELLSDPVEWEPNGRPRRAGVSSFGISGTNAHVILEEAPAAEAAPTAEPLGGPIPLALSAKAEPALAEAAERLVGHLSENSDLDPTDVAYSLATTRTAFEHRAAVLGRDRDELLASLTSLASGEPNPNVLTAKAKDGKLAYLFTGQGSQRLDMGKELYEADANFRAAFDRVCEQLDPYLDTSLEEIVFAKGKKAAALLEDTAYAQPALFAIEVTLYKALSERGLKPDVLTGHSIGEIAAAHVSGVLDLSDAAKLVAARGRLMGALPAGGAMAAIEATEAEVAESIEGKEDELSIAAINGPTSTVISGAEEAVEEIRGQWEGKGRKTKRLAVSHAFHSPLMEPMLAEFAEVAESLEYHEPEIALVSNVTGELLSIEQATDPAYWVNHVRQSVRFADAIATLQAQGTSTYLELGPDPVLCAMARECLGEEQDTATFVPTLREGRAEADAIVAALAAVQVAGAKLDWGAFFEETGAKQVPLPTYPFQRKRYWLHASAGGADLTAAGQTAADHPLLGAAVELAGGGGEGLLFTGRLSVGTHAWLADHIVGDAILLPGTAFLELALRAAEQVEARCVEELVLRAPLVLGETGAVAIQVTVSRAGEDGRREIEIHSRRERGRDEPSELPAWVCHAQGVLSPEPVAAGGPLDIWPPDGAEPIEVEYLYDVLAEHGLRYGPAFQGMGAAWRDGERIYAEVSLPEEQAQEAGRFAVHPALLDAALHAIALTGVESSEAPKLPFSWSGVSLHAQGAGDLRVVLGFAEEGVTLQIADGAGAPVATVGSLVLRPLDLSRAHAPSQTPKSRLGLQWPQVTLPEEADGPGEVESLHVEVDRDLPLAESARKATVETLASIQGWLADKSKAGIRLALITEAAMAIAEGEFPDPAAAAIWGLVRSAQSEHPGRFALIDTDGSDASEKALPQALSLSAEEPQLALREGGAYAARALPVKDTEDSLLPPPVPWRLDALERGTLESLALIPSTLEPLGPTGVRVQMHAAGLSFRDVLIARGVYPGEAPIGSEGAGVVVEVGTEVRDLEAGDRVMGLIGDAFGPLGTTERDFLARVPEGWTDEQAAALPIVFATAHYGLLDLAGLKKGERVLIHAGAGGVGSAAIQIAQHIGAEVFATASPSKWEVLKDAGLDEDHIASSRDLEFKGKFLEVTDGKGVDLVLNALAGKFVDASLELLPNGGRLLEMGKTDIRDPEQLRSEHEGVSYLPFDLGEAGAKRTGEILTEIAVMIEQGALHRSTIATWDMREAPQAFRHLREGRNVGKVVLTLPKGLDPERTTLITGATGGLGALLARHLVTEHKARHLLLVSRSGPEADGAEELQTELEELGAKTTIAACDVADRKALEKLLTSISPKHPLGAVVHCAGVLADSTVETLTAEQIERVFAPKVDAAWHLHELTKDEDLSAFVLFSSAAGTLGAPGQGNYAAANVFLDALAQQRRAEGLPATAVAWGLWEREGGMVSGLSETDLARMKRAGIAMLSDEHGLALLDSALAGGRPLTLAVPIETAALGTLATAGLLPPILSGLVSTSKRRGVASGSLATKLASLPEVEREAYVLDLIRGEVAAVLGHTSAQEVEPGKAFQNLGFDSLASVELRNRLNSATGLRLPATVVFDYPSSAALAEHLLGEASVGGSAKVVAVGAQASEEPIAIVGMACRYPGGIASPADLWQLVAEGRDAIGEFPTDRGWDLERLYDPDPEHPGTSYTREGGFVAGADRFDADFFGISPREALVVDPQQRLLLESCWEALEDAGIDPASLRKTQTGVFAGVMYQDYGPAAGMTQSIVSGRVAYTLGLEGPAITVDTACSSSLVAMHLASQALRGGECTLALAGGVTTLATPSVFVEFSRQRGLAPDGRSKSFAEAADGVAWAEGVGVLVLERLSDAKRNGHPVLATIKGSAVNQDGASNGLTAPNGPSQERVIRQALANARLEPQDVDVVEGHGTGTTLGDPIEAGALLATYGQDREKPLRLGSIKSNIGHTQAAAGVAGVIKMAEAMRRGVLPKTLHVDAPSSHVDWEVGEIELLTEQAEWEAKGGPRRAGVSSFGISGTNAHVILEQAPSIAAESTATELLDGPIPLVLSAKAEPAMAEVAERLISHMEKNPDLDTADLAYSLATTRSAFEHRAVALGSDREDLLASLQSLAAGDPNPNVLTAKAKDGKLAYLFTGQGSQRLGMGKELYEVDANFRIAFDQVCEQFDQRLEKPLKEIVFAKGKKAAALLEDTTYAQPALFAIEVALYRALAERGLSPDVLAGHSIGEIAAAHVAGVLDLSDAAKLVAARGRLMGALPAGGAMAAIEATEQEVADSIAGKEAELSIAAINGPSSTVISGTEEAVEAIRTEWEDKGRKTKRLAVSHAFHSPLMEPMLEEFAEVAESLAFSEPEIALVSNVSGELLSAEQATDPAYWVTHVRQPVRFVDAIETLKAQGTSTYLELGPDPVLCAMARECLGEEQGKAVFIPTLREGRTEAEAVVTAIGNAQVAGAKLDWGAFFEGTGAKRVPLPTYPFQRERYWLDSALSGAGGQGIGGREAANHPVLGASVELAGEGLLLSGRLSPSAHPWLAENPLGDLVLLPGAALLEYALRAAEQVGAQSVAEL
jgi:acyl transferase domain-containing protein/short-subunit dehydrogenase/acyl carrier protein